MLRNGVVVGKFYPFHKGHKFLIETALHHCEYVHVMVDDKPHYKIPAYLRANWIRKSLESFGPRVIVREFYNELPDSDSDAWAKATIDFLRLTPDACITSEDYGETWAKAMGCQHIVADRARGIVPISGTKLRGDVYNNLHFLDPHVQRYFVNTVCIVGAESTGKSTLAKALSEELGVEWVQEYGRDYTFLNEDTLRKRGWRMLDYEKIAVMQDRWERGAIERATSGLLILDTDAMVTQAFCRRDMGAASAVVEGFIHPQSLYIVCPLENPFEADGWREQGEKREWLQNHYMNFLKENRLPYIEVRGTHEERVALAIDAINKLNVPNLPEKAVR